MANIELIKVNLYRFALGIIGCLVQGIIDQFLDDEEGQVLLGDASFLLESLDDAEQREVWPLEF